MIEYRVKVYEDRTEWRNLDGKLHNENGPAVVYNGGYKEYWVDGKHLSPEEFHNRNKTCEGKTVVIDGIEYELRRK